MILLSAQAFADNTYPFSFKEKEYSPDSRIALFSRNGEIRSYYLKYNLADAAESIYTWEGISRKNAIGESLEGVIILDILPDAEGAFICFEKDNAIYAAFFDKGLLLKDSIKVAEGELNRFNNAEWAGSVSKSSKLLYANRSLYIIHKNGKLSLKKLSDDVAGYKAGADKFAFIISSEGSSVLAKGDASGSFSPIMRVQYSDDSRLKLINSFIITLTGFQSQTFVQVYDLKNSESWNFWIEAKTKDIEAVEHNKSAGIFYLKQTSSGYEYHKRGIHSYSEDINLGSIPPEYIESIGVKKKGGSVYALFRNGIAKFEQSGDFVGLDYYPLGDKFSSMPSIYDMDTKLILTSPSGSLTFEVKRNELWRINRIIRQTGNIILPLSLFLALLGSYQLYRRQKRVLNTIFALPQTGFIFVINKKGALVRANDSGKKLLRLPASAQLGKRFTHYCNFEDAAGLRNLFEKAFTQKETFTEKLELNIENRIKETFFTAAPITGISGAFKEITITGVDITEELEKKRLVNWAQLAHDMQTNLSAIRLNAQHFDLNNPEEDENRRRRILQQANILTHRVRDILAVGREDKPDFIPAYSEELCNSALDEFDPLMFPGIEFRREIQNFQITCDKSKIIRAIRNAVENALKALKDKKGVIMIRCYKEKGRAYIHIIDNGPGMSEEVKNRLFTPFFTTRKSTGGTGIGSIIMQKAIEIHKGTITINSEPGKGAELIFCIPLKQ